MGATRPKRSAKELAKVLVAFAFIGIWALANLEGFRQPAGRAYRNCMDARAGDVSALQGPIGLVVLAFALLFVWRGIVCRDPGAQPRRRRPEDLKRTFVVVAIIFIGVVLLVVAVAALLFIIEVLSS